MTLIEQLKSSAIANEAQSRQETAALLNLAAREIERLQGAISSLTFPKSLAPLPYAILLLTNLELKKFHNLDEVKSAMDSLRSQEIPIVVLKYHHQSEQYIQPLNVSDK